MMKTIADPLKIEIFKANKEYIQQNKIEPFVLKEFMEFFETGKRLSYESSYFARRRQLVVAALAYFYEKNSENKEWLEQLIWEVCNEWTWALPAHLSEQVLFNDQARVYIDLFSAETGQALAEIYEQVGEELSPIVANRIRKEVEERLILPFEKQSWEWEQKKNNWSAVIGGCVGMACLSLLPKKSNRLERLLTKVDISLKNYLHSFGEDGICTEGVGYWGYGFGYYIYYAEKLAESIGNHYYLEINKVKKIAEFPGKVRINNTYLPFSDFSQPNLPSGLLSFCVSRFGADIPIETVSSLDFDKCYRFAHLYHNLRWTKKKESSVSNRQCDYFPDAQWFILNSVKQDLFFAAKGGDNRESHNHLDVGHFVFGNHEVLFLTDLGAGEYTKEYFHESKRYQYFVTSAKSHHLPILNGCSQVVNDGKAEVVRTDCANGEITYSLAETYSTESYIEKFTRHFSVHEQKKILVLHDRFCFNKAKNEIIENFVSPIEPIIEEKKVILRTSNEVVEIKFDTRFLISLNVMKKQYHRHDGGLCEAHQIQAMYQVAKEAEIITSFVLM